MNRQHGVYKYVTCDAGEIIYIGKTDNTFKSRIDNHHKGSGLDSKFLLYKDNWKIYIAYLPNATEVELVEKALINKYKPVLNEVDNHEGFSGLVEVREPEWKEYEPGIDDVESKTEKKKSKQKKWAEDHLFLGRYKDCKVYIGNYYTVKEDRKQIKKHTFASREDALAYIDILCKLCNEYGIVDEGCYKVNSEDIPEDIRNRLVADDECIFKGTLAFEKEFKHSYFGIISHLRGSGENLHAAWLYKDVIDALTECLRLWKYKNGAKSA